MGDNSQLSQLVGIYLNYNRKRLAFSTRQMTDLVFRYLIEFKGDISAASLTVQDAEDFQLILVNQTSRRTADSYIKTVRPVFSWAHRHGWIGVDPFGRIRLYNQPPPDVRVYSPAEISAILKAAADYLWRARILAALTAGLRRGEVLNLTVRDIDFDRRIITVRSKKDTEFTWQWTPKDYEARQVPLSGALYNLLISQIIPSIPSGQPYLMLSEKRYWTLKNRIGSLPERVRITPDENFRPWQQIKKRAGIVDGCFHDLRRTAITLWSRELPYQEVMKLAGHSDLETTLRYYSAVRDDILERASRIVADF